MNFMSEYKKLDNLCKESLAADRGISAYIEAMEAVGLDSAHGARTEDYKRLKRYRYIRNQIAHEDGATEKNLCTSEDVRWLEAFYQRIIERTDPLARYESIRRSDARSERKRGEQASGKTFAAQPTSPIKRKSSVAYGLLIVLIITVILCSVAFLVSRFTK